MIIQIEWNYPVVGKFKYKTRKIKQTDGPINGVASKDQLYKRPTPTKEQLYKRPTLKKS